MKQYTPARPLRILLPLAILAAVFAVCACAGQDASAPVSNGASASLPETVAPMVLEPENTPAPAALPTPAPTPYDITGNGTVDEVDRYLFSLYEDGSISSIEELDGLRTYFDNSLLGEKFYDKFCYTGEESGEGYYRNGWVSYTLTQADEPMGKRTTRYYLVDIYVRDLSCLRTYIAGNPEPTGKIRKFLADDPAAMAKKANAVIAITGDYMSARTVGLEVRNSVWYRQSIDKERDIGVLKKDGTLATFERGTYTLDAIREMDPWQVWSFGPVLLTWDGQTKDKFNSTVNNFNPRSAIGYYEPGHYCFFMGEARGKNGKVHDSLGFTLQQLSEFFYKLGCKAAYNFDGGATACMMTRDGMISERWQDRNSSDIVYLASEPLATGTDAVAWKESGSATDDTAAAEPGDTAGETLPDDTDETNPEDRGEN